MKRKILIVEDELVLAMVLKSEFELLDFDVKTIDNGGDALSTTKEYKPDIILLDLILPVKDGFSVLEDLKNDVATQIIPVIVLSNLDQANDIKKVFELGAIDFLVKANNPLKEIIEKVKNYIYQK
jgi:two-component system, OmpR family, alkaline phosphatase synthesis response regulator PhoP